MPPISVLIKPASGKCNLKCEYCFYKDIAENRNVSDYGFMSFETLEVIVQKVLTFADEKAIFSFQGGEPTLRGLAFYNALIAYQKKHNVKNVVIENCIQTNGILLDDQWARFLFDNRFLVGLSIDGPKAIHDLFRKDTCGNGTYQTVIQKARLLEKHHVDFNILFVVTKALARDSGKVYSFFQKNNFNFLQFMPCIDPLAEKRGGYEYSLLPTEYAKFLKKFFDRWSDDIFSGKDVSIRYFDNLIRLLMGNAPEMCSMRGVCSCQFVFEADGTCFPCDFYVMEKWRLGNIRDMGIMDFYDTETNQVFLNTSADIADDCLHCKWNKLCRGGCRKDREDTLTGKLVKNYYCRSYKRFFDYAYLKLLKIEQYVIRGTL